MIPIEKYEKNSRNIIDLKMNVMSIGERKVKLYFNNIKWGWFLLIKNVDGFIGLVVLKIDRR